ncbi:helix-turn-helix transcriptional regulator [Umezawaea sp. NPDC059074]|uniref:helix-turn-helix domain-containing protein n=1 Tax=Umezawaea sp. NPDC059074 TaxID=3346716 RepID=UPI00368521A8
MKRPPFRRRKLGRRLRQMREQAGMTIDEAALALDKKRTSMYRIEAGESQVDVHLARSMMDVYDVYLPRLLDDVRYALEPGWWVKYGYTVLGYVDLESEASVVREMSLSYVPGLLQTPAYMQAVFEASQLRRTRSEIANQVEIRKIRQLRLTDEQRPLNLIGLIDESALRRLDRHPELKVEQLESLVIMSDLSTVTLRVLSEDVGIHGGLTGAFTLLEFPDQEDPDMLYIEYPIGASHFEDASDVARARLVFEHVVAQAMSHSESVALIEGMLTE